MGKLLWQPSGDRIKESPTLPVYAGQIQALSLGMKMKVYDEQARPVVDQEGELVCESPSPSMPLRFWNDPNDEKYKEAYSVSIVRKERMCGATAIGLCCTAIRTGSLSSAALTPP
jgi:hypothetical protein